MFYYLIINHIPQLNYLYQIKNMIHIEFITNGVYEVYFNKTKVIGNFEIQIDGYYGYYPNGESGYWSSYALRLVADALDEINKEWDQQVKKDIGKSLEP